MSKITVTTIAGQTSGSDANKVKIESGDTLEVASNSTVGGTLGVTGVTTLTGTLGVGTAPNATFGSHNYTQGTPAVNKPIISAYSQGNSNNAGFALLNDTGNRGIWTDGANMRFTQTYEGNSTTHMHIDANGRVTKPLQPSFQARSNVASPALSTYAGTTIALTTLFNVEYFDIGNNYNTTTSTFTAPVNGRYYFYTQLQLASSPTTSDHSWGLNLHFQINNAGNHANGYVSLSTAQGGGSTTLFGAYGLLQKENILNLSTNDTVRVALSGNANINAGSIEAVTNDGRCRFGGHLLG